MLALLEGALGLSITVLLNCEIITVGIKRDSTK